MADSELIPRDELTTLIEASEVAKVADDAESIIEEQQVAYLINSAANTGARMALFNHPLSEDMIKNLEEKGYTVNKKIHSADPEVQYVIKW